MNGIHSIIPERILKLFLNSKETDKAENELLEWLNYNNVLTLTISINGFKECKQIFPIVARAIAKSRVHSVSISHNQLEEYGPKTAKALILSPFIRNVDMSSNNLGIHAIETAKILSKSKIQSIDLRNNKICEHGPSVAKELTRQGSIIKEVDLSGNSLGQHAIKTAENLTNIYSKVTSVYLNHNKIGSYGPDVAKALTGPHSQVNDIYLDGNDLQSFGPSTVEYLTNNLNSKTLCLSLGCNDFAEFEVDSIINHITSNNSKVYSLCLENTRISSITKQRLSEKSFKGHEYNDFYKLLTIEGLLEVLAIHFGVSLDSLVFKCSKIVLQNILIKNEQKSLNEIEKYMGIVPFYLKICLFMHYRSFGKFEIRENYGIKHIIDVYNQHKQTIAREEQSSEDLETDIAPLTNSGNKSTVTAPNSPIKYEIDIYGHQYRQILYLLGARKEQSSSRASSPAQNIEENLSKAEGKMAEPRSPRNRGPQ